MSRSFYITRRLLIVFWAALFAAVLPLSGATAATQKKTTVPSRAHIVAPAPDHWKMTKPTTAELDLLKQHAKQNEIIILNKQYMGAARSEAASTGARVSAIRQTEAPLLTELHAVGAKSVKAFSIIDAVKATISQREIRRLRRSPAVRAVVPNATIKEPAPLRSTFDTPQVSTKHPAAANTVKAMEARETAAARRSTPSVKNCGYQKPVLAPEALSLTHDAYEDNSRNQAQNWTTGKGVTVAFMADGIDPYNPDFVRPNGQLVFGNLNRDLKDFTGEGFFAPSDAAEAFGDASSIASQANTIFNTNSYLVNRHAARCHNIKILGMAPGATLMALKVFGDEASATTSGFVDAIQYAVNHGANVLNQSFGSNPFPDFNQDPISLADQAAIDAGVTVVVSSGDAGTTSTIGSPATLPGVISVGATTQFLSYKQSDFYGFNDFSNGSYISNNISSFSSGGISTSALHTPDVVAPGDLGWADCSDNWLLYLGCTNLQGLPSSFQLFGGTSESSPLTAGEAALVISAYEKTHSGQVPTPLLVKQIIMSSATDLNAPAYEQGAGLINALRAVDEAQSYGLSSSTAVGSSLYSDTGSLHATGNPGQGKTFHVTVTNEGTGPKTVAPVDKILNPSPTSSQTSTVTLDPNTDQTFTDELGVQREYKTTTFSVPANSDRLDAAISWDVVNQPYTVVRLTLIAPNGAYAAYTEPQDFGPPFVSSGYGHVDVRYPMAGNWTAIIWCRSTTNASAGLYAYSGNVQLTTSTSDFMGIGPVTPYRATIAPGQSQTFTVLTKFPQAAGDEAQSLQLGQGGGAIPIILRTKIPTTSSGGTFTGILTGGNGREGTPGQMLNYVFDVPKNLAQLSVSLHVPQNYNLEAILVDPNHLPVDAQSDITSVDPRNYNQPKSYRPNIQLFWRNPAAGLWQLELVINNNSSGATTSARFNGTIGFENSTGVSSTDVPTSAATTVPVSGIQAHITVHNTGTTTKMYFVDPRTNYNTTYLLWGAEGQIGGGYPWPTLYGFVPPHSKWFEAIAQSTDRPLAGDCFDAAGSSPFGGLGVPDVEGQSSSSKGVNTVDVLASTSDLGGAQLPSGEWGCSLSIQGPFADFYTAPTANVVALSAVSTRGFAPNITTSTNNLYRLYMGYGGGAYTPLVLKAGQTGTITVNIKPSASEKTATYHGHLYVDAMDTQGPYADGFTGSSDQVGDVPFTYSVQ